MSVATADIREIVSLLREIIELLREVEVDAPKVASATSDLTRLLTTYVALTRRMGLPSEATDMIARLMQIRIMVQSLYRSLILLNTVSGPIGWATLIGGFAITGFMLVDQMEMSRPQY